MKTDEPRSGGASAALRLLPAALLLASALAALLAQRAQRDPTKPEDWQAAGALVVKLAKSADGVRTEPPWRDDALVPLGPVQSKIQRGDGEVWREDLFGTSALWIVSERDRLQRALARLPFDAAPDQTHELNTVTVVRVPVPASLQYAARLSDQLAAAQVAIVKGQDASPCAWSATQGQWGCQRAGANIDVRPRVMEMQDAARRCIWAPPPGDGKFLRITFPKLALKRSLRLRVGMDLFGARREGVPITWRARIGDAQIAGDTIPEGRDGWPAVDVDTSRFVDKPAALTVEVEATSWERRHLCFEGWIE
jgi:hypothetical protein